MLQKDNKINWMYYTFLTHNLLGINFIDFVDNKSMKKKKKVTSYKMQPFNVERSVDDLLSYVTQKGKKLEFICLSIPICLLYTPVENTRSRFLPLYQNQKMYMRKTCGVIDKVDNATLNTSNFIENCGLVRPLLSVSRFEIRKFCSFWQLPVYPDATNQKVKFLRNRVRKQVLPAVKIFFNSQIENVFLQFADIVEAEDQGLDQIAKEFFTNLSPTASYFVHDSTSLCKEKLCKPVLSSGLAKLFFAQPITLSTSCKARFAMITSLSTPCICTIKINLPCLPLRCIFDACNTPSCIFDASKGYYMHQRCNYGVDSFATTSLMGLQNESINCLLTPIHASKMQLRGKGGMHDNKSFTSYGGRALQSTIIPVFPLSINLGKRWHLAKIQSQIFEPFFKNFSIFSINSIDFVDNKSLPRKGTRLSLDNKSINLMGVGGGKKRVDNSLHLRASRLSEGAKMQNNSSLIHNVEVLFSMYPFSNLFRNCIYNTLGSERMVMSVENWIKRKKINFFTNNSLSSLSYQFSHTYLPFKNKIVSVIQNKANILTFPTLLSDSILNKPAFLSIYLKYAKNLKYFDQIDCFILKDFISEALVEKFRHNMCEPSLLRRNFYYFNMENIFIIKMNLFQKILLLGKATAFELKLLNHYKVTSLIVRKSLLLQRDLIFFQRHVPFLYTSISIDFLRLSLDNKSIDLIPLQGKKRVDKDKSSLPPRGFFAIDKSRKKENSEALLTSSLPLTCIEDATNTPRGKGYYMHRRCNYGVKGLQSSFIPPLPRSCIFDACMGVRKGLVINKVDRSSVGALLKMQSTITHFLLAPRLYEVSKSLNKERFWEQKEMNLILHNLTEKNQKCTLSSSFQKTHVQLSTKSIELSLEKQSLGGKKSIDLVGIPITSISFVKSSLIKNSEALSTSSFGRALSTSCLPLTCVEDATNTPRGKGYYMHQRCNYGVAKHSFATTSCKAPTDKLCTMGLQSESINFYAKQILCVPPYMHRRCNYGVKGEGDALSFATDNSFAYFTPYGGRALQSTITPLYKKYSSKKFSFYFLENLRFLQKQLRLLFLLPGNCTKFAIRLRFLSIVKPWKVSSVETNSKKRMKQKTPIKLSAKTSCSKQTFAIKRKGMDNSVKLSKKQKLYQVLTSTITLKCSTIMSVSPICSTGYKRRCIVLPILQIHGQQISALTTQRSNSKDTQSVPKSINSYAKQILCVPPQGEGDALSFATDNSFAYPWGKEMHGALHNTKSILLLKKKYLAKQPIPRRGKGGKEDLSLSTRFLPCRGIKSIEIENIFSSNFLIYFKMLEIEKKNIYWPIIISFLPKSFQRRVTKILLLNQNKKNIRYSQIEDFLTLKKKLY